MKDEKETTGEKEWLTPLEERFLKALIGHDVKPVTRVLYPQSTQVAKATARVSAVYQCVVEFIKWHNEQKDMNELLISFPDQSKAFTYGVEFGRILQKIEQGDSIVMNNGFPIRLENKQLIEDTCRTYGYIPTFGKTHLDEWIDFLGIRKTSTDN